MTTVHLALSLSAVLASCPRCISVSNLFRYGAVCVRAPVGCCVWGQTINGRVDTRERQRINKFQAAICEPKAKSNTIKQARIYGH